MRGAPWVGFVPSQSTDCPGTAREARRGWVHCWLLPAETADLPSAICSCPLLLLFSSFLLWTVTQRKREGEAQQLTLTFSSTARAFPISMTPSQPLLRPWRPSLIGHVVYQKTHFHFWETGNKVLFKLGKGVEIFIHLADVKIFGISNQKHQEIDVHFG